MSIRWGMMGDDAEQYLEMPILESMLELSGDL